MLSLMLGISTLLAYAIASCTVDCVDALAKGIVTTRQAEFKRTAQHFSRGISRTPRSWHSDPGWLDHSSENDDCASLHRPGRAPNR